MEATETTPTTDTPTPLEPSFPNKIQGSIFLPLFTPKNGLLHVITLQTFGRQMRYFTDPFDPILMRYTRFIGGNKPVKNATPVTIGESYVWNVHYWFGNNADLYYLNGPSPTGYRFDMPIVSTPIVRTDDLFNLNAPLEFKAAILNVAFKELERK